MHRGNQVIALSVISIFVIVGCVEIGSGEHNELLRCSDTNAREIFMFKVVHQSKERSMLTCALVCSEKNYCNYAIYRDSLKQCVYVSGEKGSHHEIPPYVQESQCFVILPPIRSPECQNGGFARDYTCQCPKQFRGKECEEPNPEFCQSGEWKHVSSDDYDDLDNFKFQVKSSVREGQATRIYPLTFFTVRKSVNGAYNFQAHHFLAVNSTTHRFQTPLQREFKMYTSNTEILQTMLITMAGHWTMSSPTVPDVSLMTRATRDKDRVFYQYGPHESVDHLLEGVSSGYRLMYRFPTRVGFDFKNQEAYYESVRGNVGRTGDRWITPFYYFSNKVVLSTRRRSVMRTRLADGETYSWDSGGFLPKWELDRCWVRVESTENYDEFTNSLKEVISLGHDVRVIMDESISSDVTMVTLTNTDVIAALADCFTPFDAVNDLGDDSRIQFSLISISKTLAGCEMAFQRNAVDSETKDSYPHRLEWFINSRPSKEYLKVDSSGKRMGSLVSLHKAALEGKDIRVCVAISDSETVCSGTSVVYLGDDGDVTVQTPVVLKPEIDGDGKLVGHVNCKQTARLVSTKGWVEEVSYLLGQESSWDVKSLEFVEMTWFVQSST